MTDINYEKLIGQWHRDRNLIDGSTDKDQYMKLIQEAGELSDSLCKGKDIRDFGKNFDKNEFLKYMTICHPSSLHHKSLFKKYGQYDISYKISSDYEFLVRAIRSIKPSFIDLTLVEVLDGGVSA